MRRLTHIFYLSLLLILCIIQFTSCADFTSEDRKNVQLVLKQNGQTFLFSPMGTMITKNHLNNNKNPAIVPSTKIVEKAGELYIEPADIKNIANLISGNFILHEHKEKTIDGYVTAGEHKVYEKSYDDELTDKIGKMKSIANIYLTSIDQTKQHHISWERSPNQSPLKNCIEMDLWVDKTYKPGERTIAKDSFIMIHIADLVAFYGSHARLEYAEDEEILYIISNSSN